MKNPPYVSDSDTSRAAALSVAPHTPGLREQVLSAIRHAPDGLTCDDVEALMNLRHQTASARVNELRNDGAIVDSGLRRPTRSGRKATVWKVAAAPGTQLRLGGT